MKYCVVVREIWYQRVYIEATDPLEAIQKVADGEGEYDDGGLEYSSTMDPDSWSVTDEDGNEVESPKLYTLAGTRY